jgi:glycosyltransferase involved in cell wall biosynthesis
MSEPLASAVIITYNQEQYIAQTIECALAQKVDFDYEIVIGEDCSTDKTREICLRYQEKYPNIIRVITSDKNVGLLDNWCRSVNAAKGKYIAGCGGDDYWHNPDKMQKQVAFLEENQEYGMVHSDADILYEDEKRLVNNIHLHSKIQFNNKVNDTLDRLYTGKYQIIAGTALFKKKYFDEFFDMSELRRNEIFMEDVPLWIIIATHSKIFYMSDSFVVHREMEGTISRPHSSHKKIQLMQSCHHCFVYFFEQCKTKFQDPAINLKTIHQMFNRTLQKIAMQANQKYLVREYYQKIITQSGQSFLTINDKIRYYSTYLPFGTRLYNKLVELKSDPLLSHKSTTKIQQ